MSAANFSLDIASSGAAVQNQRVRTQNEPVRNYAANSPWSETRQWGTFAAAVALTLLAGAYIALAAGAIPNPLNDAFRKITLSTNLGVGIGLGAAAAFITSIAVYLLHKHYNRENEDPKVLAATLADDAAVAQESAREARENEKGWIERHPTVAKIIFVAGILLAAYLAVGIGGTLDGGSTSFFGAHYLREATQAVALGITIGVALPVIIYLIQQWAKHYGDEYIELDKKLDQQRALLISGAPKVEPTPTDRILAAANGTLLGTRADQDRSKMDLKHTVVVKTNS